MGRPGASHEGPREAGIGQRRGCLGRVSRRPHPAAGSHLPAEGTAPPCTVAPFRVVTPCPAPQNHTLRPVQLPDLGSNIKEKTYPFPHAGFAPCFCDFGTGLWQAAQRLPRSQFHSEEGTCPAQAAHPRSIAYITSRNCYVRLCTVAATRVRMDLSHLCKNRER